MIQQVFSTNLYYQKKEDTVHDNVYLVQIQDMGEDCEIQSSADLDNDGFATNSEPYSTGSRNSINVLSPLGVSTYPPLGLGFLLTRVQSRVFSRTPQNMRTYVRRSSTTPGPSAT